MRIRENLGGSVGGRYKAGMRRLLRVLMAVIPTAFVSAAGAEGPWPEGLVDGGSARIVSVIDGDTVVLEDGRQVRLIGTQAPKLALGRRGFVDWPLSAEARDLLAELADGRTVTVAYGGERIDRYDRVLAQLFRDDGVWLQGEMVRRGFARVYSFDDNRRGVRELLALEEEARAAGRGIWADGWYRIRTPFDLADAADTYQLVEGRVLEAAAVNGRIYLNFGADYRTDFTASLSPAAARMFARDGFDPLALEGRAIRVRGWVYPRNGPTIDVTHPEQIELLPGG